MVRAGLAVSWEFGSSGAGILNKVQGIVGFPVVPVFTVRFVYRFLSAEWNSISELCARLTGCRCLVVVESKSCRIPSTTVTWVLSHHWRKKEEKKKYGKKTPSTHSPRCFKTEPSRSEKQPSSTPIIATPLSSLVSNPQPLTSAPQAQCTRKLNQGLLPL